MLQTKCLGVGATHARRWGLMSSASELRNSASASADFSVKPVPPLELQVQVESAVSDGEAVLQAPRNVLSTRMVQLQLCLVRALRTH